MYWYSSVRLAKWDAGAAIAGETLKVWRSWLDSAITVALTESARLLRAAADRHIQASERAREQEFKDKLQRISDGANKVLESLHEFKTRNKKI